MNKILKKVQLSTEQSTPMSADPTKGTQTNPYTEQEMRMLQANETWPGGYVEEIGYVVPCTSSYNYMGIFDDWWSDFLSFWNNVANYVSSLPETISHSAFGQALGQYQSGPGESITLDVSTLGLSRLRRSMLTENEPQNGEITYGVNLLNPTVYIQLIDGLSLDDKIKLASTAIALGNITLKNTGGNNFTILSDSYDFNMHDWKEETVRNIETLIGWGVNEFLSVAKDKLYHGTLGVIFGASLRHVVGTTEFQINFTGTLNIPN